MENEKIMVEMTEEQKTAYEAYKEEAARKQRMEENKKQREDLQTMTDEVIASVVPDMLSLRDSMSAAKAKVMAEFEAVIALRKELLGAEDQDSWMFTNKEGTQRVRIGYNILDGYGDDVEIGIKKVKDFIAGLAKDDASKTLVNAILRLLSKNQKGQLKASRVMQLNKMAEESGDEQFLEGMKIIRDAYSPVRSAIYVKCYTKEGEGAWKEVPLTMSDID